ncbi:hypothetical protein CRUP_006713 [Coryphaenoides rupestris]|nr:hypothetical protein CRUP_006713 [Coryphaenoides rupestris]
MLNVQKCLGTPRLSPAPALATAPPHATCDAFTAVVQAQQTHCKEQKYPCTRMYSVHRPMKKVVSGPLEGAAQHTYNSWDGYSLPVFFKEGW